jgi:S1-C subfamily serine protease
VTVNSLSDQLAEYFGTKDGVLVASVTERSAAEKAGVKAGDVIVSVNGETVRDAAALRRQMQSVGSGGEFTLGIVRDRKPQTLKGKLESQTRRLTRTIL